MMTRVTVREAETHLSDYLEQRVEAGETIVICRDDKSIAEVRPAPKHKPRQAGMDMGVVHIPPEFFDPLPDDLLRLFNGEQE